MKIKAVLFDIDGTILDTLDFVFSAVKYTLRKYKYRISKKILTEAAGRPLLEYYQFILPSEDHEKLANTHRDFQKDKHTMNKPFPNVKKVLQKLKKAKIKIAGVSNRSRESLIKSLQTAGIYEFFDVIVAVEDVERPKPHKDHPLKALESLGIDKGLSIMVGDAENDILAGKNAGIETVGVTYGWIGEEIKKSKPDFVIDKIEDLLKILN